MTYYSNKYFIKIQLQAKAEYLKHSAEMFRNFKGHKMEEFYTAKYIKAGGLYETPPISIIKGLYNEVDEHVHT